jgi:outer membrane protein, heavy metal efflux system
MALDSAGSKMKISSWQRMVVLCAVTGAHVVWANPDAGAPRDGQRNAAPITLSVAFEAAWQRAVAGREAEGVMLRARADRVAASSWWAAPPSLELAHRTDRWSDAAGRKESEAGIAWPLWLPGQRAARSAEADAGLSMADTAGQAGRLRIAGEVREAAWTLVYQRAEAALAEAHAAYLERLASDVDKRVLAGDLARADALVARAEALSAKATQSEMQQRLVEARTRWKVLTGLDALPDPTESRATAAPPAIHPEAKLAMESAERARRRLDTVRTSRRDPPELVLRWRDEKPGLGEPSQRSIGLAVRMPFGTPDRNQPMLAAASSEADVAQAQAVREQDKRQTDLDVARQAVRAAELQAEAESQRAVLLRERANLIEKSFRAGERALPDLLRALSAAAQAEAGRARQDANLGLARARLQQALGYLP